MAQFHCLLFVLFAFISLCQSIQEETIKEDIRTEHKNIVSLIKQRAASENGQTQTNSSASMLIKNSRRRKAKLYCFQLELICVNYSLCFFVLFHFLNGSNGILQILFALHKTLIDSNDNGSTGIFNDLTLSPTLRYGEEINFKEVQLRQRTRRTTRSRRTNTRT